MDPIQMLLEEFREYRRESRADMNNIWEALKDLQQKGDARMTKIEVEQGKQKVRTGFFGAIAGALTGIATRLF